MPEQAIILGASGLIGSNLLEVLLSAPDYQKVLVLARKELPVSHAKLTQLVVDFDRLNEYASQINGDVIFSCLGSTRQQTPDLKEYRKIDHDYPVFMAKIAKEKGIRQFHLVSSVGANSNTSNFYTKMKGETEDDVIAVGLRGTYIYRPSFLRGRKKGERSFEGALTILSKLIDPLLVGSLKKYRSIPGRVVAVAMYKQSQKNREGVFIYPSDKIKEIA